MTLTTAASHFECLEPRQLLAFVVWDGGGGDSLWSNPLNWSGDAVPTASDNVLIDAPASGAIHIDQDESIASLYSLNPVALSGGTFSVAGLWRQSGALSMSGGTVAGAANLALSAAFSWTGGAIGGDHAAKIQVLPGSTLTIDGDVTLGRILVNNGTVVWNSGDIDADGAQIQNLLGRTFTARSGGSITPAAGTSYFVNRGTLVRDGSADSTTTIGVNFSNPNSGAFPPTPGTVDAHSGTLQFTGPVAEKQGERLAGGVWSVTSTDGRLLLPGGNITDATAAREILLSGAGAAFPQMEGVYSLYTLRLENGRQFTFASLGEFGYVGGPDANVVIDSADVPITIQAARIGSLTVVAGTVTVVGGLDLSSISVGAGATLVLGGGSFQDIDGAGTVRITGNVLWQHGGLMGTGQVQVASGGTLSIVNASDNYYGYGHKVIAEDIVNDGTIDWADPGGPGVVDNGVDLQAEILNRGQFTIHAHEFAYHGYLDGTSDGSITNLGTMTIDTGHANAAMTDFKLRAALGPTHLHNEGIVHVAHGRFLAFGGVDGGGTWMVDAGAALVFGGFADTLSAPVFAGAGLIRVGSWSVWTNANVMGAGDLIIGYAGRLGLFGLDTSFARPVVTNLGVMSLAVGSITHVAGDFVNTGVLALSGGDLRITGNLTLASTSVVRVRSTSASAHGSLSVTGRASLAGTLHVVLTWPAPAGTVIDFLTVGSRTGAFPSLANTGLSAGTAVRFQFIGNLGEVSIVSA
jgi:hypothetical protein